MTKDLPILVWNETAALIRAGARGRVDLDIEHNFEFYADGTYRCSTMRPEVTGFWSFNHNDRLMYRVEGPDIVSNITTLWVSDYMMDFDHSKIEQIEVELVKMLKDALVERELLE